MFRKFSRIYIVFLVIAISDAYKSYENYKVYKLIPNSDKHIQVLNDLSKEGYDFWSDRFSIGSDVRVLVSPDKDVDFVNYTSYAGLNPTVGISNVQQLIEDQMQPSLSSRSSTLGSLNWNKYNTLEEIHSWLDELQDLYPDVVTTMSIGRSYEGRELKGIIIDFKRGSRGNNPLIGMIEGGIHAVEWISPATVTWIIKEFLTTDDADVSFLAETFIWHIIPVTNPDGYVYTFTSNRMWRKNRNPSNFINCTSTEDDLSNGIDLNRNFDYLWMTTGASPDPCAFTYAGPSPLSEPESQAISNYVLNVKQTGNIIYYLAFHSYGQMILLPYSHLSGLDVLQASNYGDMYEIAIRGAQKIPRKYGTPPYRVGTAAEILYVVTGSSVDWAKGVADIPITYTFELRDIGDYGFLLPASQIIPTSEEIVECLLEMDKTTRIIGYYSSATTVYSSVLSILTILSIIFTVQ